MAAERFPKSSPNEWQTATKTAKSMEVQEPCQDRKQREPRNTRNTRNPKDGGASVWIVRVFRVFRGSKNFLGANLGLLFRASFLD
jgi:hypothetical protein